MKITLTAKLKLLTTPEQCAAWRATSLAYRDALNHVSAYSFVHGKTGNVHRLQKAPYSGVRSLFGAPAQMACPLFRQVGATYRGLWTKWHKNQEALKAGHTKKRFKGLDKAPHYVTPTLTYVFGHGYSIAWAARLEGSALWFPLHQAGCGLYQSGMPEMRLYKQSELERRGLALGLSELPLHPPCRLSGARSLSLRTLVIRKDWMATGPLSVCPDVTNREAKAVRLQRYAELRWSPVTSLPPKMGE